MGFFQARVGVGCKTERLHFHFSLSCIGEGNGNPLHCSCLENPRDGRAWWAAIHGVAQSQARLKRLSSSSSSLRTRHKLMRNKQVQDGGCQLPLHLDGPWVSVYTHLTHQQAKWHARQHRDSSKANRQRPECGWWPNSWKSLPLPQNGWINSPAH